MSPLAAVPLGYSAYALVRRDQCCCSVKGIHLGWKHLPRRVVRVKRETLAGPVCKVAADAQAVETSCETVSPEARILVSKVVRRRCTEGFARRAR
jgi:hypothetical protein